MCIKSWIWIGENYDIAELLIENIDRNIAENSTENIHGNIDRKVREGCLVHNIKGVRFVNI